MKKREFRDIMIIDASMFDIEKWDKFDLFHNYERLKSYITIKLGAEYFEFFARPKTGRKKHEVIWQSDLFDTVPVVLSSLSGYEYDSYKAILDKKTEKLKQFILHISGKESNDVPGWAQLLSKAMLYGGDDFVFCGDGKVTVAAWSMKPGRQYVHNPGGATVPSNAENSRPESTSTLLEPSSTLLEPNSTLLEPTPTLLESSSTLLEPSSTLLEPSSTLLEPSSTLLEPSSTLLEPTPTFSDVESNQPEPIPSASDIASNRPESNEIVSNTENIPPSSKKKCSWWKWLLYILAALLLGLLLLCLLRQCSNTGAPVLPNEPGVLPPVDPGDVDYDDDSVSQVVTNRLNILLESDNIEGFASDFKKAYPGDKYRIIYFDTIVRRLQIQIPKEEKSRIREELPQKLSQYSFVIYDESMFEGGYRPSDPAMNDRVKNWYLEAIKAPKAWDVTLGDPNVIVAIIDDGFDISHPELSKRVYLPYNAMSRDRTLFPLPHLDSNGEMADHGTHTSGTAVGEANNGAGLTGVAPGCKYMPVQAGDRNGQMSTTSIMDALLYAIYNKADVVNMSLGLSLNEPLVALLPENVQRMMSENMFREEERVWNEIYKIAAKYNTVIVQAAGNDNVLTAIDPMKRGNYCIHVSAVGVDLARAKFSNWGERSTVSAPGVEIFSSVLNNCYVSMDGTSMAAPIVTGAVALIRSVDKTMSPQNVASLLQKTGIPVSSSRKVGNLIQLDKALAAVSSGSGKTPPADDCRNIARKIDSLTKMIAILKQQCPQYAPPDTMKLPEIIEKPTTLNGRWKSTTDLFNMNMERVSLYFDFDNGRGTFSLVEGNGKTCSAPIRVKISGNTLEIIQDDYAMCADGSGYQKYIFSCRADKNGNAECIATRENNKLDKVKFNLVKIS
jgi:subtilisin family serine protease